MPTVKEAKEGGGGERNLLVRNTESLDEPSGLAGSGTKDEPITSFSRVFLHEKSVEMAPSVVSH